MKLRLREIAPALFVMTNTYPNENNIASLNDADWAWEFLRRNPDYKRDYRLSRARLLKTAEHTSGGSFIRVRRRCPCAETWGLICMSDPSLSPMHATVAWASDTINWAIETEAKTVVSPDIDVDFDLETARFEQAFVIIEAKQQNLYMRIKSHSACFELTGDSVLPNPVKMRFIINSIDQIRSAISVLQIAQTATGVRTNLVRNTVPYTTQLRRLKYLIAAEKAIEGSFLRDIGAAIYGSKRTEREWKNLDSRAFKDEIVRAKRKGLHLLNGGYREFLN